MWVMLRCGAPQGHHDGPAAASGPEDTGLHGEKSEEREYLEDVGPLVPVQSQLLAGQSDTHAAGAPVH